MFLVPLSCLEGNVVSDSSCLSVARLLSKVVGLSCCSSFRLWYFVATIIVKRHWQKYLFSDAKKVSPEITVTDSSVLHRCWYFNKPTEYSEIRDYCHSCNAGLNPYPED